MLMVNALYVVMKIFDLFIDQLAYILEFSLNLKQSWIIVDNLCYLLVFTSLDSVKTHQALSTQFKGLFNCLF